MRKTTLQELGVNWVYYLCIFGFLAFGSLGIWLLLDESGTDRIVGFLCAALFVTLAVCGIFWPILRLRESHGIIIERVRTHELNCEAILFPASRVKHYIALLGSFGIGITCIGLFALADSLEYRIKALIAVPFYLVVFAWLVKESFGPRKGVLLRPDGVLWRSSFYPPCFVSWNEIVAITVFGKAEQYSPPIQCVGIILKSCDGISTSSRTRKKLLSNHARFGVHLYIAAEDLLAPPWLLAVTVEFYRNHPEVHHELGTSAAKARIEGVENDPLILV